MFYFEIYMTEIKAKIMLHITKYLHNWLTSSVTSMGRIYTLKMSRQTDTVYIFIYDLKFCFARNAFCEIECFHPRKQVSDECFQFVRVEMWWYSYWLSFTGNTIDLTVRNTWLKTIKINHISGITMHYMNNSGEYTCVEH